MSELAQDLDDKKGLSTPIWVGIAIACLVVGVLCGHFLLGGASGVVGGIAGKTTISEGELDHAVGSFTYKGQTTSVSARDVITATSSLNSAKAEDGSYKLPKADGVLAVARTKILLMDAEAKGIKVTDDDVSAYAKQTLGSDDYATIASSHGMDADTVKELLRQSAIMGKLREQVVTAQLPASPTAPTAPAGGEEATATAEYAKYVIGLAGDEWDSDKNGWVSADSPYATALANYTVSNDSATYEAAKAAYYVAYQKYTTAKGELSAQWSNYVNDLLCNASVSISTLMA
ncbi:hypothetical protein [Olsenella urininfantis]|uniref:hypothetical protein n=1 Tax=Olsenella urininfantis TaxID=1871033 RepID=UPI000985FDFA|nr:hypothetical protein [Olsenella urininfantis]